MIQPTNLDISTLQTSSVENCKNINATNSKDEKLKETARNFEAVLVGKMLNSMEQTVEKTGFLSNGKYEKMFKSYMYNEVAKDISSSPHTSFGLAKQIYEQMKDRV